MWRHYTSEYGSLPPQTLFLPAVTTDDRMQAAGARGLRPEASSEIVQRVWQEAQRIPAEWLVKRSAGFSGAESPNWASWNRKVWSGIEEGFANSRTCLGKNMDWLPPWKEAEKGCQVEA